MRSHLSNDDGSLHVVGRGPDASFGREGVDVLAGRRASGYTCVCSPLRPADVWLQASRQKTSPARARESLLRV